MKRTAGCSWLQHGSPFFAVGFFCAPKGTNQTRTQPALRSALLRQCTCGTPCVLLDFLDSSTICCPVTKAAEPRETSLEIDVSFALKNCTSRQLVFPGSAYNPWTCAGEQATLCSRNDAATMDEPQVGRGTPLFYFLNPRRSARPKNASDKKRPSIRAALTSHIWGRLTAAS